MNINHPTQIVIHSFSQQILTEYLLWASLSKDGGHQEEDGPPSINTYLTISTHWIPDGLG